MLQHIKDLFDESAPGAEGAHHHHLFRPGRHQRRGVDFGLYRLSQQSDHARRGARDYGLGLRHAVDADHIAAIDNVTRKLMQENKRPVSVGFFFAMGHSTVVIIAAGAVAVSHPARRLR